ncbi:MAG: NAD(P)-dependent oxidoreductase [Gammaproteobacteria bacterium]|nr:NAD(P)-dependent oxidoreductase [Gammaproteobacteria bacterium]
MAIFVTGGYGHIGSWTALLLARQGQDIIVYDTNDDAPGCLAEVANRITFIKGDVLNLTALREALEYHHTNIDGVVHTVATMGEFVEMDPHQNVNLNVMGLVNVLEFSRVFEIEKVLYTSTGAVYGVVDGLPTESLPLYPTDLYASTKISAEHIGIQYAQTFGMDFRVARLYFVYGPGKLPSRFIKLYKIAFGALEGLEGLNMDKGADQKLDFTYVEDAARGIALLFNAENLRHKVFNIATGKAHSVGEVVELVRKHTHSPVPVHVGPGELMRRSEALDISRAATELGYEPKVGLEEGIKHYADWLRDHTATAFAGA